MSDIFNVQCNSHISTYLFEQIKMGNCSTTMHISTEGSDMNMRSANSNPFTNAENQMRRQGRVLQL